MSSKRQQIKDGLSKLPECYQGMFRRMYSAHDLSKEIDEVVDGMPEAKLDFAIQQVERSIEKFS